MIKLFCKLKRDKLFLSLVIAIIALILFDVALVSFDIAQLLIIQQNSANLSFSFITFNIFIFALNFLGLVFIAVYFIIKNKVKIKIIDKK